MSYQADRYRHRKRTNARSNRRTSFTPTEDQVRKAEVRIMGVMDGRKVRGCMLVSSLDDAIAQLLRQIHYVHDLGADKRQRRVTVKLALCRRLGEKDLVYDEGDGKLVSTSIYHLPSSHRVPTRPRRPRQVPAYA